MKLETLIFIIFILLLAYGGYYGFTTVMQKSFSSQPEYAIDGESVRKMQTQQAEDAEWKRKQMMEDMRQKMRDQQMRY